MATFLPTSSLPEIVESTNNAFVAPLAALTPFHLSQEVLKSLVNVIELLGVQLTLEGKHLSRYDHHVRVLAVGLGWTFAESLILYLIPLWMGARGMEFDWQFIQMGVASNINLVIHVSLAGLVWLRGRTDLNQSSRRVLTPIFVAYLLLPLIQSYLEKSLGVDSLEILGVRFVFAIILAATSRSLLTRYTQKKLK